MLYALLIAVVLGVLAALRAMWRHRWRPRSGQAVVEVDVVTGHAWRRRSRRMRTRSSKRWTVAVPGTGSSPAGSGWRRSSPRRVCAPRRSETSAELVKRLLIALDLDPRAIGRLAALYREARFSEHDLGEDRRAEARSALRALHEDLRSRGRVA